MSKLKLFYRQTNYLEDLINTSRYKNLKKTIFFSKLSQNSLITEQELISKNLHSLPTRERVRLMLNKIEEKCKRFFEFRESVMNILWRLIEIHLNKLIAFAMIYVALNEVNDFKIINFISLKVSAFNMIIILLAVLLILEDNFLQELYIFLSLFISLIIFIKMIYQMEFIKENYLNRICFVCFFT